MAAACNREANKVVTARPATPSVQPTVVEKETPKMERIGPSELAPDMEIEKEPMSRASKAAIQARKAQQARIAETGIQEVIAELRQTACEGDCPVFTLKVMTDFSLRYEGVANVDLIGNFTGTVPFNPMSRLVILASRCNFYNLPSSFPKDREDAPADFPSTVTTIDYRSQKNTVEHIQGGPEKLIEIENYLRELVNQANWTEVIPEE